MKRILGLMAAAAALGAADLPITRVVIYKNGVAYFERAGEVKAGEAARLEFKASEMDDVLKSLIIEDQSGAVTRLRYELSEPLQKKLADLPVQIQSQQALVLLLDQLRGAPVEVRTGSGAVTGTIVSGRLAPLPDQGQKQELVLLLASGQIQIVDLGMASGVSLQDPRLEAQLKEALGLVNQSRSRDKRVVFIEGSSAARKVAARYLVPAPIWKSTYRLVLPASGEPTLEGWALVDNTSGEDWNNVDLTVVSGRPVSFVSKLYEPRYVTRTAADLPELRAAAPTIHEGAVAAEAARADVAQFTPQRVRGEAAGVVGGVLPKSAPAPPAMLSTVGRAAEGREAGDLFEYRFPTAVTAKRGESAMIPFLQQKVSARPLLIYSDPGSLNPRSAAELTNNTGKTLDGGPLTVYQGGSYGGEALMETLKAGDKRLVSFAIDLGTRVTTNFESGDEVVREVRVNRGMLLARSAIESTTTYTVSNVDAREKTLIIEHRVRPNYKLLKPKATETTPDHYRFSVAAPAKGSMKLAVVEEQVIENSEAISSVSTGDLVVYAQSKTLSPAARKQLEAILEKKRAIDEANELVTSATTESGEIIRDQERIRQNINALNRVSGQQEQVQRYAQDLARQDAALAALRDQIAVQRKRQATLQAELNVLIEKLQF